MARQLSARFREEIRGVAEGSGVPGKAIIAVSLLCDVFMTGGLGQARRDLFPDGRGSGGIGGACSRARRATGAAWRGFVLSTDPASAVPETGATPMTTHGVPAGRNAFRTGSGAGAGPEMGMWPGVDRECRGPPLDPRR